MMVNDSSKVIALELFVRCLIAQTAKNHPDAAEHIRQWREDLLSYAGKFASSPDPEAQSIMRGAFKELEVLFDQASRQL